MAVPTLTRTGTGSAKATGTSLAVTVSTTSYSTGDFLRVSFVCDPSSGTVSFAKTAGTATVGAWTTIQDQITGSGTSGFRVVTAAAPVTAGGTITTVTITHPSLVARAAEVFKVAGADTAAPQTSNFEILATSSSAAVTPPSSADALLVGTIGNESSSIAISDSVSDAAWTLDYADAASIGTSGGAAASNVCLASVSYTRTAPPLTSVWCAPSGSGILIDELWQATGAPVVLNPKSPVTGISQAVYRGSGF